LEHATLQAKIVMVRKINATIGPSIILGAIEIHNVVTDQPHQASSKVPTRAPIVVASFTESLVVILDCLPNV